MIPLAVDHNHTTGKIRGLLCSSCNLFLGLVENTKKMKQSQEYLKLWE
jgi:Recombination endonuclease VII.